MNARIPFYTAFLLALVGSWHSGPLHAQSRKQPLSYQKELEEQPQEEMQQGGYQAPPPTGALQGPTRELGFSGGEIELPAIRLRFPRIRLPAFTQFITPPQMRMERGVAPLVTQVQEQVAVPAGEADLRTQPQTAPQEQPQRKDTYQKYGWNSDSQQTDVGLQTRERASIEARFESLEQMMEKLMTRLETTPAVPPADVAAQPPTMTGAPAPHEIALSKRLDSLEGLMSRVVTQLERSQALSTTSADTSTPVRPVHVVERLPDPGIETSAPVIQQSRPINQPEVQRVSMEKAAPIGNLALKPSSRRQQAREIFEILLHGKQTDRDDTELR